MRQPRQQRVRSLAILHVGGLTHTNKINPSVSTNKCRLRPLTFLPGIIPARPTLVGDFDGLTIDNARAGLAVLADALPQLRPHGGVNLCQTPRCGQRRPQP